MNQVNVAQRNEVVPALEFVTVWAQSENFETFLAKTGMTAATAKARAKSLRKGGTNLPTLTGEAGTKGRKLDVAGLNATIAKLTAPAPTGEAEKSESTETPAPAGETESETAAS